MSCEQFKMDFTHQAMKIGKTICPVCKDQQIKIVRISDIGRLTDQVCWICFNPACPMFINYKDLENWRRKNEIKNYFKNRQRQLSPDYNPNCGGHQKKRPLGDFTPLRT